jgi:hypothetical protein
MVNNSIRIRTTPGVDKNVRIKLEQDFDFLEVLSLKISQEDLYQSFCSNYGVVVGRVIANKGFGVPNTKISIFIPIDSEDQKNELIKDLYPFKSPIQKDKNGVRYNLLLSKSTCTLNTPVGTFPTKEEMLDNEIILDIFDKYYKYTTKTNESGDFMLFGVPVGIYTLHIDIDLSDIGALSLRPYDLINEGYPEKLFESKTKFKSSTNLDSLPQIKSGNIGVEVIPFWGDLETCEIGITRVDYDTNIDIPTNAIFFGSIFTDNGKMSLNRGCNPKNDMGEQDQLKTGAGIIDMVRVSDIDPLDWYNNNKITPTSLETFSIDGGELIDDNGTFAFLVPMNIGKVITDEFGNLVPSNDPNVGLATKGMYRFKMRFAEQPDDLRRRTGNLLVPSLGRDFGGTPGYTSLGNPSETNGTEDQRFTDDINVYDKTVFPFSRLEMDFHTFEWKQIYSIAHFIKKFKKGGNRFSFLGIKDTDKSGETNLFPFNNAIWKFDILYYILALFVDLISLILSVFISLISLSIGFCIKLKLVVGPINVAGQEVFPQTTIFEIDRCISVEPFGFIGDLFPQLESGNGRGFLLPGDGCGPNGEGYELIVNNCTQGLGFCNPSPCSGNGDIKFDVLIPNQNNNNCLQSIKAWECCVKLNIAENRNTIVRVFNDAWVVGTAYLFQFKYKKKVRKNGVTKEKFCGPGADNRRGDNYRNQKCCIDLQSSNCDKCLLRGPNATRPYNNAPPYHEKYHNDTVPPFGNFVTPPARNGASDINDIIYCNALMSTKIVNLGRVEMCEETFNQIENSILANQALKIYQQNPIFYTGTFFENGWDPGFWVKSTNETSYQDPREVLQYLAKDYNCSLPKMFLNGGGCHEYELKSKPYFFMKEVSKIYNDVVTVESTNPSLGDIFNPLSESNPIANSPDIDLGTSGVNGGFEVNVSLANRFSPCSDSTSGPCVGAQYNGEGIPWSGVWNGGSAWPPTTMGFYGPNSSLNTLDYDDLSNNNAGFDRINSENLRNNKNTKTNIPYFYFGLIPGKTAINKLLNEFFYEK